MSNELPFVSKTAVPLPGAVQRHQTERDEDCPAWEGSPVSRVALRFDPLVEPDEPEIEEAFAKLSLPGRDGADARYPVL